VPEDLIITYRKDVASQINAEMQTDSIVDWDEWKRLFYFYKLRRNIGWHNEWFLEYDPDQYFQEVSTDTIETTAAEQEIEKSAKGEIYH